MFSSTSGSSKKDKEFFPSGKIKEKTSEMKVKLSFDPGFEFVPKGDKKRSEKKK